MQKNIFDDGLRPELFKGFEFAGILEISKFQPLNEFIIPQKMVPFSKRHNPKAQGRFVHFYEHERYYMNFSSHPEILLKEKAQIPGIISPDNSMFIDAPLGNQLVNLVLSRRNGVFLQKKGFYVVPNIRWGDERTFTDNYFGEAIAFSGIPRNSMVCIGTYGCCQTKDEKQMFHRGLVAMLRVLTPRIVLVYGSMPKDVFCDLPGETRFIQYVDWTREMRC